MESNVFFVGAPKCGTSTLYKIFNEHTDASVQTPKETHFYSFPEVKNTYYDVEFKENYESYNRCFLKKGKVKVDFSPSYLRLYKYAIPRIKEKNRNAKIVIIMREPVKRAISHYLMDIKLGYQNKSISKSLQEEKFYREYVESGLYFDAINAYKKNFNDVYIVTYEELFSSNENILKVINFTEVNITSHFDINKNKENQFENPRSVGLVYTLRKLNIIKVSKKVVPVKIFRKIREMFFSAGGKPDFNELELAGIFHDDISKLDDKFPELSLDKYWRKHQ
ncbi:sulfotransferase domain-containing protein [Vibrio sp. CyArs1]|uniref:sulfotransferase domain-containing protein n=1 Tax=Vibrio sp. CyArs1 TaxID=2682577 RepID=UPI001F05935A|nr:sulfotransferase domain-containing protein [Vibrio sp. CyArs1]